MWRTRTALKWWAVVLAVLTVVEVAGVVRGDLPRARVIGIVCMVLVVAYCWTAAKKKVT